MSQVESPLGALDIESTARHEWLSWTKMADVEREAPPVLVGGDGPYVIEADGTRLLDAMSGLFTTQIGYSHGAEIGAAAAAQMERLAYYPNWAATNPATLALTERILALAPPQMSRIFFTSGGSESVESAWKLARQHFQARGESSRRIVISRHGSYHGCSLGALSITGIPAAKAPFEPLVPDTRHVLNTDPRQNPGGDPLAAADAIEQAILAEGPENVCMVILEPVQNAGGMPRAAARLRAARARDLRSPRRAAVLRRGHLRVRAPRALVRLGAPRLHARPDHVREGRHVGLRAARRRDLQRGRRGAAARERGPLRPRLHVRRPPGLVRGRAREPRDHGARRRPRQRARGRAVPRERAQRGRGLVADRRRGARLRLLPLARARRCRRSSTACAPPRARAA